MESAWDPVDRRTVDGEELRLLERVDQSRYICTGCDKRATPASYQKHNKQRPHFRALSGHDENCEAAVEEGRTGGGGDGRVLRPLDGPPGPMPQELRLRPRRGPAEPGGAGGGPADVGGDGGGERPGDGGGRRQGPRVRESIRPLARAFIRYPTGRRSPLHVPEAAGDSYETVFRELRRGQPVGYYRDRHIFFAPLRWNRFAEDYERPLTLTLDAGLWQGSIEQEAYRLVIDWAEWGTREKEGVFWEAETAREEAKGAGDRRWTEKAWAFFLGEQDEADPRVFTVCDSRLICFLFAVVE